MQKSEQRDSENIEISVEDKLLLQSAEMKFIA